MKVRSGYVSNSSSSSFIIAYKEDAELKLGRSGKSITMRDFIDAVERSTRDWSSDETQLVAYGEENVVEREQERWSYDDSKEMLDGLGKFIEKHRKKGVEFATVKISYHDKFTRTLYDAFKESKKLIEYNEQEE